MTGPLTWSAESFEPVVYYGMKLYCDPRVPDGFIIHGYEPHPDGWFEFYLADNITGLPFPG